MTMMRRCLPVAAAFAVALLLTVAPAGAQPTNYDEIRSGGFGTATLPPDAQEWFFNSFGNSYKWDLRGRVLSNAAITQVFVEPGTPTMLETITMGLWSTGDADLFKIKIVDPEAFSASVGDANTSAVLALFAEDGTAIKASRGGGVANAITTAGMGLSPGFYYIGEATASGMFGDATFGVPRNDANQPLFDFTTDGVKLPIAQADMKLSSDPFIAWTVVAGPNLLGSGNFTLGGSTITLAGADFAAIPEPASMTLIALAAAGLLRRRRA